MRTCDSDSFVLIETEEVVDALEVADPERLAYLTQTTLSVDETDRIIRRLRERFPNITSPKSDDICYATTNRQMAVRQMARECDLVLVIGSSNSSNSNRLVEVARRAGCPHAQLVQDASEIDWRSLDGARSIGVTAGASAPEEVIDGVIEAFRARFDVTVEQVVAAEEDVEFKVPRILREPA